MNGKTAAAIGVAAVAALGGVGYMVADSAADARARTALEEAAGRLGTGEQLSWSRVDAEPIGRAVVVEGLSYRRADGIEARVASLHLDGVSEASVAAATASGLSLTLPGLNLTVATVQAEDLSPPAVAEDGLLGEETLRRLVVGLSAKRLALTDVRFSEGGGAGTATLAALAAEGVKDGRYDRLTLSELTLNPPDDVVISLGAFSMQGLDLSSLSGDEAALQRAAADVFGASALTVETLSVTTAAGDRSAVASVIVDGLERLQGRLVSSRMRAEGVDLPAAALAAELPPLAKALETLGRDRLTGSLEASQRYVAEGGALTFGPWRLSGDGLGELLFQADLTGVPMVEMVSAVEAGDMAAVEAMGMQASFAGASLSYTDEGLADVLLDDLAQGDRAGLADMAAAKIAADVRNGVLTEQDGEMLAGAVRSFITGANGFSVSLKPAQPVLLPVALIALQAGQGAAVLALTVKGH